jgi:hypothetical protein
MKNLFEPARATELTERIARLRPDSQRRWGTMTAPQAMAHCSVAMEWAVLMYKHVDHHLRQFGV